MSIIKEKIKVESGAFIGLKSFENVNWRYILQNVRVLKDGIFEGLSAVSVLNLTLMQITRIESGAFHSMTNLVVLNLTNNMINEHVQRNKEFANIGLE